MKLDDILKVLGLSVEVSEPVTSKNNSSCYDVTLTLKIPVESIRNFNTNKQGDSDTINKIQGFINHVLTFIRIEKLSEWQNGSDPTSFQLSFSELKELPKRRLQGILETDLPDDLSLFVEFYKAAGARDVDDFKLLYLPPVFPETMADYLTTLKQIKQTLIDFESVVASIARVDIPKGVKDTLTTSRNFLGDKLKRCRERKKELEKMHPELKETLNPSPDTRAAPSGHGKKVTFEGDEQEALIAHPSDNNVFMPTVRSSDVGVLAERRAAERERLAALDNNSPSLDAKKDSWTCSMCKMSCSGGAQCTSCHTRRPATRSQSALPRITVTNHQPVATLTASNVTFFDRDKSVQFVDTTIKAQEMRNYLALYNTIPEKYEETNEAKNNRIELTCCLEQLCKNAESKKKGLVSIDEIMKILGESQEMWEPSPNFQGLIDKITAIVTPREPVITQLTS